MKNFFGECLLVLAVVLLFAGCKSECHEKDDSRNERKFIKLESPVFPSGSVVPGLNCPVLEDPAELVYTTVGNNIDAHIECDRPVPQLTPPLHKWALELEVNGQCAEIGSRYLETFRFQTSAFNCSDRRAMEVTAVEVGGDYVFHMCPDPHVPNNHGYVDYIFDLYVRSNTYSATEQCNCQNLGWGLFPDMYFVRARSTLALDMLYRPDYFDDYCQRQALVFYDPIMYNIDCL